MYRQKRTEVIIRTTHEFEVIKLLTHFFFFCKKTYMQYSVSILKKNTICTITSTLVRIVKVDRPGTPVSWSPTGKN